MYLKSLHLENFKCFEQLDVHFHPHLTVLVGVNGAGKTTVLEGAAVAVSTLFASFDGIKSISISRTQAHLKAYSLGSTRDVQAQYPVRVGASAEIDGADVSWARSLNTAKGQTTVRDANPLTAIANAYQERLRKGDQTLILPVLAYYGTGRLWDYHREKQSDLFGTNTRTNGYIDSLDGTANIKLMMNSSAMRGRCSAMKHSTIRTATARTAPYCSPPSSANCWGWKSHWWTTPGMWLRQFVWMMSHTVTTSCWTE